MKSIFPLLIIVFMISTSCDEDSFSWESNPPEVRLVILNESDLADKAIGDSINIELGFDLYNMQNLYFLAALLRPSYDFLYIQTETTSRYTEQMYGPR